MHICMHTNIYTQILVYIYVYSNRACICISLFYTQTLSHTHRRHPSSDRAYDCISQLYISLSRTQKHTHTDATLAAAENATPKERLEAVKRNRYYFSKVSSNLVSYSTLSNEPAFEKFHVQAVHMFHIWEDKTRFSEIFIYIF